MRQMFQRLFIRLTGMHPLFYTKNPARFQPGLVVGYEDAPNYCITHGLEIAPGVWQIWGRVLQARRAPTNIRLFGRLHQVPTTSG
jgi:hypothetical protein